MMRKIRIKNCDGYARKLRTFVQEGKQPAQEPRLQDNNPLNQGRAHSDKEVAGHSQAATAKKLTRVISRKRASRYRLELAYQPPAYIRSWKPMSEKTIHKKMLKLALYTISLKPMSKKTIHKKMLKLALYDAQISFHLGEKRRRASQVISQKMASKYRRELARWPPVCEGSSTPMSEKTIHDRMLKLVLYEKAFPSAMTSASQVVSPKIASTYRRELVRRPPACDGSWKPMGEKNKKEDAETSSVQRTKDDFRRRCAGRFSEHGNDVQAGISAPTSGVLQILETQK